MFIEDIEVAMGISSIPIVGYPCFYNGLSPDCSRFVQHIIDRADEAYGDLEYAVCCVNPEDGAEDQVFRAKKWMSVDEYKALIIEAIEKYIAENDDKMKNVQLYRERGAIFKECKH
jgi:hypothetical protein